MSENTNRSEIRVLQRGNAPAKPLAELFEEVLARRKEPKK